MLVVAGSNTGQWFDEITSGNTQYSAGVLKRSTGDIGRLNGVLSDLEISDGTSVIGSYLGHGNLDEDWTDKIGSNDGAVIGSPANIRIPADGATDALGVTTRNIPVSGHNDAESVLNFEEVSDTNAIIPETAFMGPMTADMSVFAFDFDISSDDNVFYRAFSSLKNDRHTIYIEDLTGDNLTALLTYTNSGGK